MLMVGIVACIPVSLVVVHLSRILPRISQHRAINRCFHIIEQSWSRGDSFYITQFTSEALHVLTGHKMIHPHLQFHIYTNLNLVPSTLISHEWLRIKRNFGFHDVSAQTVKPVSSPWHVGSAIYSAICNCFPEPFAGHLEDFLYQDFRWRFAVRGWVVRCAGRKQHPQEMLSRRMMSNCRILRNGLCWLSYIWDKDTAGILDKVDEKIVEMYGSEEHYCRTNQSAERGGGLSRSKGGIL